MCAVTRAILRWCKVSLRTGKCGICGESFSRHASASRMAKYCSKKCASAGRVRAAIAARRRTKPVSAETHAIAIKDMEAARTAHRNLRRKYLAVLTVISEWCHEPRDPNWDEVVKACGEAEDES